MKPSILIVDDEKDTRELMARALGADYHVTTAADAELAIKALEADPSIALMLSDVRMPGADGLQLLKAAKKMRPNLACILLTAFGTVDQAVAAMKDGADDFIMKPVDLDQLDLRVAKALKTGALESEVASLRSQLDEKYGLDNMVGSSAAMERVFKMVRRAAPSSATVLLQGPNGTGKDLIAHAIHNLSPRAKGPFVAVNCGAIPENLIESELFGHEKGSFSGAVAQHIGSFESANHGTLFLDEVGELPLAMQVKLLRALENRSFTRVGGSQPVEVDIRVIAATNRDLKALVDAGGFRQDLFYRLNVIDIHLPALKDRVEDIPLLVSRFIKELSAANGGTVTGITPAAMKMLEAYSWPGNVRELRNAIEKMVVLSSGGQLDVDDIPDEMRAPTAIPLPIAATGTLAETEKAKILAALQSVGNNRSKAARVLGISRRTLYRKLDEYAREESDVAPATLERRELHPKMNFSKQLVDLLVLAALNLVPLTTCALPQTCFVPCHACKGKKSLLVTPPSRNPYRSAIGISNTGEIGVSQQGIKYDRCPLCDGKGRLERFNMAQLRPPTNVTDMVACPHCRACGVERCRKCARKGLVPCPRCANNKSGKSGWVLVSERKTGERKVENRSGYKRREEYERITIPCAFCNGIGVIECSECAGLGGTTCKKCDGEGYVLRKGSK